MGMLFIAHSLHACLPHGKSSTLSSSNTPTICILKPRETCRRSQASGLRPITEASRAWPRTPSSRPCARTRGSVAPNCHAPLSVWPRRQAQPLADALPVPPLPPQGGRRRRAPPVQGPGIAASAARRRRHLPWHAGPSLVTPAPPLAPARRHALARPRRTPPLAWPAGTPEGQPPCRRLRSTRRRRHPAAMHPPPSPAPLRPRRLGPRWPPLPPAGGAGALPGSPRRRSPAPARLGAA
mmetsp:Transcript_955/g.1941  ORF Transcript_955/g.1941 Transcript_955/m.1941 type:complete len:238 (+) Transcript_955:88-801(+)